jgi:hypothetical protein
VRVVTEQVPGLNTLPEETFATPVVGVERICLEADSARRLVASEAVARSKAVDYGSEAMKAACTSAHPWTEQEQPEWGRSERLLCGGSLPECAKLVWNADRAERRLR